MTTTAKKKTVLKLKKGDTLTRADLANAVYETIGLTRAESLEMVETVLEEMTSCLIGKENLKIAKFGSFILRAKKQRIGRNPKTGEEYPISARRVVLFRPSVELKGKLNKTLNAEIALSGS